MTSGLTGKTPSSPFERARRSLGKKIALYYVIRKESNPIAQGNMTEEEDDIYNTGHRK